jgi:hypothetical protein
VWQNGKEGKTSLQTPQSIKYIAFLMMEDFDITPYKLQEDIIQQTVQQIVKDFSMFGMDIYFSGHMTLAYNEVFRQLSGFMEMLIVHDFHKLLALLYQIDLNDQVIVEAENEYPDIPRHELMAELIVHRELQKVVSRKYYKQNKDNLV